MLASSLLIIFVSAVQVVTVCEWGKYGHNCDQLCSDHCRLHPVRNRRPCHKDTGKCLEGCVRGRHGDHCDQLCCQNCINSTCNQGNGGCTLGCIDGYSGYFCNRTTVSAVQDVLGCELGKYGHNCDQLCSDHCGLYRNRRPCHKVTGKCLQGCVRGRHGDHCDQLCSQNCIYTTCNQVTGGCTLGCIDGYSGYFCNTTRGTHIQTTASIVQSVPVCDMGKYGQNCDLPCSEHCGLFSETNRRPCHKDTGKCLEGCVRGRHGDHCDQLCSQNCISTTCIKANGGCTIGCIDGYSGYFCNRTTDDGHFGDIMHWMLMLLVAIFMFTSICCWKRKKFEDGLTWLIRRNPRASSSDPSQDPSLRESVPLTRVTTQASDLRDSSDPSQDLSQSERVPLLSTASHATPSQADSDLYYASREGDFEEVRRILSMGLANINSREEWSRTPVIAAAERGHKEVVELLVREGSDVSLVDGDGNNLLHRACVGGHVETAKFVLSLPGLDIDARNNYGRTATDWARYGGHKGLVTLLVSRGAQ